MQQKLEEVKNGEPDIPHTKRFNRAFRCFLMRFGGRGEKLGGQGPPKKRCSDKYLEVSEGLYLGGNELEIDQFLKKIEGLLLINLISD